MMFDLDSIQKELAVWHDHNFPNSTPEKMIIGTTEELGELAHANLKGGELSKDLTAEERDAIGDMIIFLAEYCNMRGFCLSEIIAQTWEQVRQRDYLKERLENERRTKNQCPLPPVQSPAHILVCPPFQVKDTPHPIPEHDIWTYLMERLGGSPLHWHTFLTAPYSQKIAMRYHDNDRWFALYKKVK